MFAILMRHENGRRRELYGLFSVLRMELINRSFVHATEPVTFEDLMPAESAPAATPRRRLNKRLRTEIAESCRRLFGAMVAQG